MKHRTALRLLVVALLLLTVLAVVPGLRMQLSHAYGPRGWPALVPSVHVYGEILRAHHFAGLFGLVWPGMLGVLALRTAAIDDQSSRTGMLAVVGVVSWIIATLVLAGWLRFGSDPATKADAVFVLIATIVLSEVMIMAAAVVALRGRAASVDDDEGWLVFVLRWACASRVVGGLVTLGAFVASADVEVVTMRSQAPVELAVLGLVMVTRGRPRSTAERALAKVAVVGSCALMVLSDALAALGLGEGVFTVFPGRLVSLAIELSVPLAMLLPWRSDAANTERGYLMLVRGGFALFAVLLLFKSLLSVDAHIHETYYASGRGHLRLVLGTLVAGALAMRHFAAADYQRSSAAARLLAEALVALGLVWMVFVMLAVGQEGMPKGYASHVPEFTPYHQQIAAGGVLLVVGVLLEGLIWWRGQARRRVGERSGPQ